MKKRKNHLLNWGLILLLACWSINPLSSQTISVTGNTTFEFIPNQSFEDTNTAWTFYGATGITNNSNPALNGNPDTPFGNRLLFMRGGATAAQTINTLTGGCFRFNIWAAQFAAAGNNQTFRIFVDDLEVAEITPASINYESYYSTAITLSAGPHYLELVGDAAGQIVLLDNISLENLPCWSNPNIWSAGTVPTANDSVFIANDKTIVLNTNGIVNQIEVQGQFLAANNKKLSFDAERIRMMGPLSLWEWGQENTPFLLPGIITLRGDTSQINVDPNMGSAFLGAMNGATVHMHGQKKVSWTQLGQHANYGDQSITLADSVDWVVGDSIVIASTDFDCHQAETRRITTINGNVITFAHPLRYNHFGELQVFDNGNHTLDQRAEVGLLNRNLKIQGDADSELDGYGGHVMIMTQSKAYLSGLEFYRMGQKAILGRYPMHWHKTGELTGQYVSNSSIHRSFNRVITVHSSTNALVEDNVAYDHIGNGYFLENGDETGNRFIHNLGILTRAALPGEEVRPYDFLPGPGMNNPFIRLPATFWITHPANDFVGNACGGSEGSGYWMTVQHTPIEVDTSNDDIFPRFEPLGLFDDNRSHSTSFSNFSIDLKITEGSNGEHKIEESGTYRPSNIPVVKRFTSFKSRDRAIWMRTNTLHFDDCNSADNGRSTFFSYNNVILNSLYVGKSANVGTDTAWLDNETVAGRSLPLPFNIVGETRLENQFRGHPLYDGPTGVVNCHFADFYGNDASIFSPNTAATKSTVHYCEQLTFENVPTANKIQQLFSKDRDFQWTTGLIDIDGTFDALTNAGDVIKPEIIAPEDAGRRVYEAGFNHEPGATYIPEWEHFICPDEHYAQLLIDYGWGDSNKTPMYSLRSDGPATLTEGQGFRNQIPVMANADFRYYLQFHRLPSDLRLHYRFLDQNDTTVLIVPNIPSGTSISKNGSTVSMASDLAQFNAGNNEQYFLDNNTLYLRMKATSENYTPQFGTNYKYISIIDICQDAVCVPETKGGNFGMPLADFEKGLDSRANLNVWGDLNNSGIAFNANASPSDGIDDGNSFSITTDGDPIDEYVEYRIDFFRQVWSEFNNLKLTYTGPQVQVFLHDASEGNVNLGFYKPDACYGLDLTRLTKAQIDEVDGLIIRVYESYLGDLSVAGLTDQIDLKEIFLDYSIELSEFHFDEQGWLPVGNTELSASNGILQVTTGTNGPGFRNDLFAGKAPVDATNLPKVIVRMKINSTISNNTLFGNLPWFGDWEHVNTSINNNGQFNNYLYTPIWSSDYIQRVRVLPTQSANPGSTMEVDFVRFTNCEQCYDEVQNGLETGLDCGGPECLPCTCEDGILNGDEEAIDCGGSCPNACSNLVLEHKVLTGVSENWQTINTDNDYTSMVVIATPIIHNPVQRPVVTRIRNITSNSFDIRIQNPSGTIGQQHTVHYVAVEEGVYTEAVDGITMEAVKVNSSLTSRSGSWVFENQNYQNTYTNPVVLGQIQSFNDSNWSVFWASATGVRSNPPAAGTTFSVGKHVGQDNLINRADESIGYLVMEQGVYQLDELLLATAVGADIVRGHDNGIAVGGYQYSTEDDIAIETVVLSSAAMDGGDGGWPVLYPSNSIIANTFKSLIEEDQIGDNERAHTPEQVAYLAFGSHSGTVQGLQNLEAEIVPRKTLEAPASDLVARIKVFPNPAKRGQLIYIQDAQNSLDESVALYTSEGRMIAGDFVEASPQQIILKADLVPGIYFIVYHSNGVRQHQRLIVLENTP